MPAFTDFGKKVGLHPWPLSLLVLTYLLINCRETIFLHLLYVANINE